MRKWAIVVGEHNEKIPFLLVETIKDAEGIPSVKVACMKYGEDRILPTLVNGSGGFSHILPEEILGFKIIESDDVPVIPFSEKWSKNDVAFDCGWVAPDGTSYRCAYFSHMSLARDICNEFYKDVDKHEIYSYADDVLLRKGWAKVSAKKEYFCDMRVFPTEEQQNTFARFGITSED